MFISVIIPTLGRSSLKHCLRSLKEQNYPANLFEVLVVNDSGLPQVESIVKEYGYTYFSQEHRGPAVARNRGAGLARGDILAFTDDDCSVPPDWLSRLADGYRRYPAVAGVGGYMEAEDKTVTGNPYAAYERYMTREVYGALEKELLDGFKVPTGGTNNLSYRKDIFVKFGGFDENFPYAAGEDADLKKRICDAKYQLLYLPLKVTHCHNYNLSSFIRQNRHRGIGSLYFHHKHGGLLSRFELVKGLLLIPVAFTADITVGKIGLSVALLKALATAVNYTAQLRNYGKY